MEENLNLFTKYEDLIKEKNFYRLLLNVKTDIRKNLRKNSEEGFKLLLYITSVLTENCEFDSAITLVSSFLDEYDKSYNKEENDLFLSYLLKTFNALPENDCNKSGLKHRILRFFESKHIQEITIKRYGLYILFAKDSILNNDLIDGYRYALKSEEYETISKFIDCFLNSCHEENEKNYFIARLCLELILMKNISLAFRFINKYIDSSQNYQKNHIILNLTFFILILLKNKADFNVFSEVVSRYKDKIFDPSFGKYLNKISSLYYNKTLFQETNFNIMNILNALS